MNRDPFYQQIIERLGKTIDPDEFERCVADILNEVYPGLAPIPGGKDSGMDGAIPDGEGEPFSLVATTQKNVIGNLTKSLTSYLESGRKRRKVVLATSQKLSPTKIQNLYERAEEMGFWLVNVHPREDISNRLYHRPEWCKELLNLTGKPLALSIFPKTDRPIMNMSLIGREDDLRWLCETKGDRLLAGQPGSGKSFLLHRFAKEGNGLFVVDENCEEIANGIRSQEPSVLIVDDAQIHPDLLVNLIQIRQELHAEYSILASCWVGDKAHVKTSLHIADIAIYDLALLTRPQIVEVINDAGLGGSAQLVHEIVNQAEGRPGLAAVLSNLCLAGGVKEVVLGEALSNSVRRYFENRLGSRAIDILAAFSVGGDAGMDSSSIAEILQIPVVDIHRIIVELGSGGILWETLDKNLSVHPSTLRYALIRDVFFHGAYSLPIQPFIERSPNINQSARSVVGAYHLGAKIPLSEIISLIDQANSLETWEAYASSGEKEAAWVIDNHPEFTVPLARPALMNAPEKVIPMLFRESIDDLRQLHSTPDHPLRTIEDWIKDAWPGSEDVIIRRRLLIQESLNWLRKEKDARPSLIALRIAFNPTCESFTPDPGSGNTITIRQAYLQQGEMQYLWDQWPDVFLTLRYIVNIEWKPLQELASSWAFPKLHNLKISPQTRVQMKGFASQIIHDLASMQPNNKGLLHWAKSIAKLAKLDIKIQTDPIFGTLYPMESRTDWQKEEEIQLRKIKKLVAKWIQADHNSIISMIVQYENEAQTFDINWPRLTPQFCFELSQQMSSPGLWVKELMAARCRADLVTPFLQKSARLNEREWQDLIIESLKTPEYSGMGISIALQNPFSNDQLVEAVFEHLSGYEHLIRLLCLRNEIPERIIQKLLRHPDPRVASAAAIGIWMSNKNGIGISESIIDDWRKAIIHSRDHQMIYPILPKDPGLAYEWLVKFLQEKDIDLFESGVSVKAAVSAVDQEAKLRLLDIIPSFWEYGQLIEYLIGSDLILYQSLLQNDRLGLFHLVPLVWCEEEGWIEKARLAIKHGISPKAIAQAVYGYTYKCISWVGHESKVRQEWVSRFELLSQHPDAGIREIGKIGKESAEKEFVNALEREHHEEVFGYHAAFRKGF
ncbi:MAG: hypothetical protein PHQ40_19315 [Anaerolineaceae bacterium]|nr:hypothetical protein [Anaerolineaceae bacterium]